MKHHLRSYPPLSSRQQQYLLAIRSYYGANGVPPTTRDLERITGLHGPYFYREVPGLIEQGLIKKVGRHYVPIEQQRADMIEYSIYSSFPLNGETCPRGHIVSHGAVSREMFPDLRDDEAIFGVVVPPDTCPRPEFARHSSDWALLPPGATALLSFARAAADDLVLLRDEYGSFYPGRCTSWGEVVIDTQVRAQSGQNSLIAFQSWERGEVQFINRYIGYTCPATRRGCLKPLLLHKDLLLCAPSRGY